MEQQAETLENQGQEAQADVLENQADAVREAGQQQEEAIDEADINATGTTTTETTTTKQ